MGYSTPYITFMLILIFLSILSFISNDKKTHHFLSLITGAVFIVFIGCRGYVQTDTLVYSSLYDTIDSFSSLRYVASKVDSGYVLYMWIIKYLGFSYQYFVLISTIIDLILLIIIFRYYFSYKYFPLFIIVFISFSGLGYEINLFRNVKSILLFLISIRYIQNRELSKFMIINLIGLSFHWSSILFFPLYFVLNRKLSLKSFFTCFFIGVLIYILSPIFLKIFLSLIGNMFAGFTFAAKLQSYIEIGTYSVGKTFSFLDFSLIIFYFIIAVSYNKTINKYPESICFFNLFIFYFFAVCMSSAMIIFRQRIALLFVPTCWFLFIWIIMAERRVIKFLIFTILSSYSLLLLYRQTRADIFYQYDNYLLSEKVISLEDRLEVYHLNIDKNKED